MLVVAFFLLLAELLSFVLGVGVDNHLCVGGSGVLLAKGHFCLGCSLVARRDCPGHMGTLIDSNVGRCWV